MDYEVELKYRRESAVELEARIRQLGAEPSATIEQRDAYFDHPVRDFRQTDEAFRIRSEGEHNRLTYKGPKVDQETKTRAEVEVVIAAGSDARRRMFEMLKSLGFREVMTIIKHRRSWRLDWETRQVEVVFDHVERLGQFVELETIATESEWKTARDALKRLAAHLNLQASERRSYLELLLAESTDGTSV